MHTHRLYSQSYPGCFIFQPCYAVFVNGMHVLHIRQWDKIHLAMPFMERNLTRLLIS